MEGTQRVTGDSFRWRDLLHVYAKNYAVFSCPSDPGFRNDPNLEHRSASATSFETTNVIEGGAFGENDSLRLSVDAERRSSYAQDRVITLLDSSKTKLEWASYHGERMNVLFLDGRVQNITVN